MKTTTMLMTAAAFFCTIAACDGPKERAGAAKDEAAANASGVPYQGDGPAERAGRAADRVDRAAAKALDSRVDALEDQGHAIEAQADAEADKLEQQAQSIRDAAKAKAKKLNQQAESLKSSS
ncbi:hypothetical protein [Sphingobium yanoikuyae]|jgi:hypothetical protein|uniref:hypothetical protein n=1 Tax=Sphingobium yanoikuyae TaxID=13690 RepID=UPI00241FEF81|nr:hypothetical protein [Sphingobium yanoikuyae]HWT62075.1 hypothetical protein [Ochrobactrum sp.]